MKHSIIRGALVGACLAVAATGALGQGKVDLGKRKYDASCASCHGPKGMGDGRTRPYLTKSPTNLTTLAHDNKGVSCR